MLNPCKGCNLEYNCENENTDVRHECSAYEEYRSKVLEDVDYDPSKIVASIEVYDFDGGTIERFEEDGLDGIVAIGIDEGEKTTTASILVRGNVNDYFVDTIRNVVRQYYPRKT